MFVHGKTPGGFGGGRKCELSCRHYQPVRGVARSSRSVPVRVYDRRDTSLTSVKGLPVDVLKRIAGQSDLATTLKCYTNTTD